MANFNHTGYLEQNIEGLRCQRHEDWELIVTDDGSIDLAAPLGIHVFAQKRGWRAIQVLADMPTSYKGDASSSAPSPRCRGGRSAEFMKAAVVTRLIQLFKILEGVFPVVARMWSDSSETGLCI